MILITGMPRSGTTYLLKAFASHGTPYFVDMHHENVSFRHNEPGLFAGSVDKDKLENFSAYWGARSLEKKCVVKSHSFRRHKHLIGWFDSVIICVRGVDSWLKSASRHHVTPKQAEAQGLSLLDYGKIIYSSSVSMYQVADPKRTVLFHFDKPEEAWDKIAVRYGLDHDDLVGDFRGSRHAKRTGD